MDRASSLTYPGGRTIAGWWRQLAPLQPLGLWIGYAFLHRIEAAVLRYREQPIDPLAHQILQALALEETLATNHLPGVPASRLQERLHLPPAVVQRVIAILAEDGLLTRPAADRVQFSDQGREALARASFRMPAPGRCVFPFVERLDAGGERIGTPHFLPIAECPETPWQVDADHRFDVASLQASLRESADWKKNAGFPLDVEPLTEEGTLEAWQQVVVDRPERVLLALVAVNAHGSREVLGFAAKADGWTLYDRSPVVRVPAPGLWPEMAEEPPMSVWQETWRAWCRQRQLPVNEVEICSLKHVSPRLEVQAPPRLVQRLQAAKSDLFKGEAWLLVGEGFLRTAVQLIMKP